MGRLREGVGWFGFLLFLPDMDRTGSKRETWDRNITTKQNTQRESPQTMELGHGGRLDVEQRREGLNSIIFKWDLNATRTSSQLLKTCPRSTSLTLRNFRHSHTLHKHMNYIRNRSIRTLYWCLISINVRFIWTHQQVSRFVFVIANIWKYS